VPVPTVAELEQWKAQAESAEQGGAEGMPQPIVHGEGWSAVVELPAGEAGAQALRGEASAMVDMLTEPVDGGRILETSLVTVLLTDDGRVLAGAVTADRLLDAAASGR
jgi:hypothetical protein